jgi:hypothetical protein
MNRREVTFGPKLDRLKLVELKGPEMPLVDLKSHTKEKHLHTVIGTSSFFTL